MKKKINYYLGNYVFDENIPTFVIEFDLVKARLVNEIEFPKEANTTVITQEDDFGEIGRIEVVNPEAFIASDLTKYLEINGHNVKQLVRKLLAEQQQI